MVKNLTTGEVLPLDFKVTGRGKRNQYVVEGFYYENEELSEDSKAEKTHKLFGKWTEQLTKVNL